jgi:hypothetical protein
MARELATAVTHISMPRLPRSAPACRQACGSESGNSVQCRQQSAAQECSGQEAEWLSQGAHVTEQLVQQRCANQPRPNHANAEPLGGHAPVYQSQSLEHRSLFR